MPDPITLHTIVTVTKEQVSCDLKGEAAILNLQNGVYYGLNPVGARIWALIHTPRTVNEIRDILLKEYEVEPDRCESDLFALLQSLAAQGLIETRNETPA
jgi:hypothetical protein